MSGEGDLEHHLPGDASSLQCFVGRQEGAGIASVVGIEARKKKNELLERFRVILARVRGSDDKSPNLFVGVLRNFSLGRMQSLVRA